MKDSIKKEIENLIRLSKRNITIEELLDIPIWYVLIISEKLSEDLIREFQYNVNWEAISEYQKLSENFIREFKDIVNWDYISRYQNLSEDFIREFQDYVDWNNISKFQKLSEDFIQEFQFELNWTLISESQILSDNFRNKFENRINQITYLNSHKIKTTEEKSVEMKQYAEEFNLKFDGEYLYAFRNHDKHGRGEYNQTIFYENGKYYRDWHCDMRDYVINSFGLGIWPEGNTPVKVSVNDWGLCVNHYNGKCRVWGFTVIGERKED